MDEHRKAVMRAYQDATAELRKLHDDEFHQILARIYKERGITVAKRSSRKQAERKRLQAALELVAQSNAG